MSEEEVERMLAAAKTIDDATAVVLMLLEHLGFDGAVEQFRQARLRLLEGGNG